MAQGRSKRKSDSSDFSDQLSIESLPVTSLDQHVLPSFDVSTLVSVKKTSRRLNAMFSGFDHHWRDRVAREFGIPLNYLCISLFRDLNINHVYMKLYHQLQRLKALKLKQNIMDKYFNHANLPLLIACCLDHRELVTKIVPADEADMWLELAIQLRLHQSAMTLFAMVKNKQTFFHIAIRGGDVQLVEKMLDPARTHRCLVTVESVTAAKLSRNKNMIQLVRANAPHDLAVSLDVPIYQIDNPKELDQASLTHELEVVFRLQDIAGKPSREAILANMIECAIENDALKLISFLITRYTYEPDYLTVLKAVRHGNLDILLILMRCVPINKILEHRHDMLNAAARGGHIAILEWLLQQFGIVPGRSTMDNACQSGNRLLILWLKEKFSLLPTASLLSRMIPDSPAAHIIQLLDPALGLGLYPDMDLLDSAAYAGDYELVEYLISVCKLTPTPVTLGMALNSGSTRIIAYLLRPEFQLSEYQLSLSLDLLKTDHANDGYILASMILNPAYSYSLDALKDLRQFAENAEQYTPYFRFLARIVQSDICVKEALHSLSRVPLSMTNKDKFCMAEINRQLQRAHDHCSAHYFHFMSYVLIHPERSNLSRFHLLHCYASMTTMALQCKESGHLLDKFRVYHLLQDALAHVSGMLKTHRSVPVDQRKKESIDHLCNVEKHFMELIRTVFEPSLYRLNPPKPATSVDALRRMRSI